MVKADHEYDLLARRLAKCEHNGSTWSAWRRYFHDGLQVVAKGTGTRDRTTYTLAPSAIGIGILPMNTGGTPVPRWCHFDRLGSVVAARDEKGDVVRVFDNTAFSYSLTAHEGDAYDDKVSDVKPYHLTTKESDTDTGLYYFNERWYDKNTGRFVSEDPEGTASSKNQYSYVYQNPPNGIDPARA